MQQEYTPSLVLFVFPLTVPAEFSLGLLNSRFNPVSITWHMGMPHSELIESYIDLEGIHYKRQIFLWLWYQ